MLVADGVFAICAVRTVATTAVFPFQVVEFSHNSTATFLIEE